MARWDALHRKKCPDQSKAFHKQDSSQLNHQHHLHHQHQQGSIWLCFGALTNFNWLLRCTAFKIFMNWVGHMYCHPWTIYPWVLSHHNIMVEQPQWTGERQQTHASVAVGAYLSFVVMAAFTIYLSSLMLFIAALIKHQSNDQVLWMHNIIIAAVIFDHCSLLPACHITDHCCCHQYALM